MANKHRNPVEYRCTAAEMELNRQHILRVIAEAGEAGISKVKIMEATRLNSDRVKAALRVLHKSEEQQVRICGWFVQHNLVNANTLPYYAIGIEPDEPKPNAEARKEKDAEEEARRYASKWLKTFVPKRDPASAWF